MINQENGKEEVREYKGKGGYSAYGLEQRVTNISYWNHVYEIQGDEDSTD